MCEVERQHLETKAKKGPVTLLTERVAELEAGVKSLKNDYLRALADFDNFRKRTERDIEMKRQAGVEALFADLLPVLDNFERALGAPSDNIDGIKKGIELIHKELCAVLKRHGLNEFSCQGQVFDPKRAEAIGFVECEEKDANLVVEELCKGYEFSGRVIRPARVKVGRAKLESGEDKAGKEGEIAH
ncbi:MAG: nucleotide exchange factor GrpE [candidate division WOR-3 bacterium]